MALNFTFTSNAAEWKKDLREKQKPVAEASVAALRDVAATSVQEGRKDIAAAGPGFTRAQWQSGLQYRTKETKTEDGAPSLNAKATIYHKYGIAGVFEYGPTTIRPKGGGLMWIPAAHKGSTASRFDVSLRQKKGGMTRSPFLESGTIGAKHTPALFDKRDKRRDRKPVFIGVPEVTVPDLFHITEITEANFENFGVLFYLHFKDET